jgi:hypothetical protein
VTLQPRPTFAFSGGFEALRTASSLTIFSIPNSSGRTASFRSAVMWA